MPPTPQSSAQATNWEVSEEHQHNPTKHASWDTALSWSKTPSLAKPSVSLILSTMYLPVAGAYLIERWKMDIDERGQRTKESVPSRIRERLRRRKGSAMKRKGGEVEGIHELHAERARHELPTSRSVPELEGENRLVELAAEGIVAELEEQRRPVELEATVLAKLPGDTKV